MAHTIADLAAQVATLTGLVNQIPALISNLQAEVTAAVAQEGISADAQAALETAFSQAQTDVAALQAVVPPVANGTPVVTPVGPPGATGAQGST